MKKIIIMSILTLMNMSAFAAETVTLPSNKHGEIIAEVCDIDLTNLSSIDPCGAHSGAYNLCESSRNPNCRSGSRHNDQCVTAIVNAKVADGTVCVSQD